MLWSNDLIPEASGSGGGAQGSPEGCRSTGQEEHSECSPKNSSGSGLAPELSREFKLFRQSRKDGRPDNIISKEKKS